MTKREWRSAAKGFDLPDVRVDYCEACALTGYDPQVVQYRIDDDRYRCERGHIVTIPDWHLSEAGSVPVTAHGGVR